jgi:hypothetical protein
MGQQQLLLVVLVVMIVAIAIYTGLSVFMSNKSDQNRQAIIADLISLGSKAQTYYKTPPQLGGGSNDFKGYYINPIDTGNGNGSYSVATGSTPTGSNFIPGSISPVTSSSSTIYIVGCGKDQGDNNATPVKCYLTVTASNSQITILN